MRRIAAALGVWLCAAAPVLAQDKAALPLVGVLRLNTAQNVEPFPTIFRNALAALGQVDGRNIRIDLRLAEGHAERFPDLAQALVNENASVIVASGDAAVRAAQQATHTIPIIGIVDDIVGAGLINSLAKPGGNTMGVSMLAADLDAKRIEVLKQIAPSGLRFAILNDATNASAQSELFAEAGRLLGVKLALSMFAARRISPPLLLLSRPMQPKRSSSTPRRCYSVSAESSAGLALPTSFRPSANLARWRRRAV